MPTAVAWNPTMKVTSLAISDVKIIVPKVFCDPRGVFSETYSQRSMSEAGIGQSFVQDNQSVSHRAGTVRGLHFQVAPHQQGKLVRVVAGKIYDVAVDIRQGSQTFGHHVAMTISAVGGEQIWVPPGFAHGYCTLEPDTVVLYKTTAHYAPDADRGLQWDDPALGIVWPVTPESALLSDKDRKQTAFRDLVSLFNAS